MNSSELCVVYEGDEYRERAVALAEHLGVALRSVADTRLRLILNSEGLSLSDGELFMRGDYSSMKKRLTLNNLRTEMLVRATTIRNAVTPPLIMDATAGMGEDSLLLAAAGYEVILCEYNPVIAALLDDTLIRMRQDEDLRKTVSRMHLAEGNCIDILNSQEIISRPPDIIYLDPMFPKRQKSGLIKKKFQLLQQLEAPEEDGGRMLEAAMERALKRIVIKRPAKAPYLGDIKPDYSIKGSSVRYDCINLIR
ncbi:MAG: class I SAM-dependent methyltransferase [Lachnospiraceae bacterium]|nr:class I SAM-dependent methyltransferase [Lachnospiraceae bacterium]